MALYLSDNSVISKPEFSNAEGKSAYVYNWTHMFTEKWHVGSHTTERCHLNKGVI